MSAVQNILFSVSLAPCLRTLNTLGAATILYRQDHEAELQRHERENLLTILKKIRWKIKGVDGAAELLEVKPTTLMMRTKKMGLNHPTSI